MEKEQKKYLLKGDISGIQEIIFNVQSVIVFYYII